MNILIAPDSFKGSLSAYEFCEVIEIVLLEILPDAYIKKLPMADGGEGTVDALILNFDGSYIERLVSDPLMDKVKARYGYIEKLKTAVIEMSSASGLPLVETSKLSPMISTTYGTGELIKDALDMGCKRILLGIGGSATNDGGLGALSALGAKFYNENGFEISLGAKGLLELKSVNLSNLDKRLSETEIIIACDVDNPLYGINGAAYVYGKQKGADEGMLATLDDALINLSEVIKKSTGKDISNIRGVGAAGGFGAGFISFTNATIRPGFEMIDELVNVRGILENVDFDLIITGEGQMNYQTLNGKLPMQIAKIGKEYGVKTIAIVGSVDDVPDEIYSLGMSEVFSLMSADMSVGYAMENVKVLLAKKIIEIMGNR